MEKQLAVIQEVIRSVPLCWRAAIGELQKIKILILHTGIPTMIKSLFQAIEALCRAVIYVLILTMGVAVAGLGAYTIIFLAFRTGQFLWTLIFKEPWL